MDRRGGKFNPYDLDCRVSTFPSITQVASADKNDLSCGVFGRLHGGGGSSRVIKSLDNIPFD